MMSRYGQLGSILAFAAGPWLRKLEHQRLNYTRMLRANESKGDITPLENIRRDHCGDFPAGVSDLR